MKQLILATIFVICTMFWQAIAQPVPPAGDGCAKLSQAKGTWSPTGAITWDKSKPQSCSQNFACGPGSLTSEQNKCKPVVSSTSPVNYTGTCVPKDPKDASKGCSSCLATPNGSCTITFVKK